MTSKSANAHSVVILTYPHAKLLDVAGPLQVFSDARHFAPEPYQTALVTLTGQTGDTDAGVSLSSGSVADWADQRIGTFLIAGGPGAIPASKGARLLDGVKALAGQAQRVGSICTGAFVLAAAGLLDGRRAVTHWESCGHLARKHPDVSVLPNQIYVRDGAMWTSAGVTAGIDMALAMVAQDHGRKVAMALARSLVTFMVRPGGQSQFSQALQRQTQDTEGRFDALHDWVSNNLTADLRVEKLAEKIGMSARSFARIYLSQTGSTPAKAVEHFRVEAASRMLEQTDLPISSVAHDCGFGDDERLRRAMQRTKGVSPSEYRDRFGEYSAAHLPSDAEH